MPGQLTRNIAAQLRRASEAAGLSQTQVGEAIGQSQSQTSKYLRGEVVLDVEELNALCDFLGLDILAVVANAKDPRTHGE
jgi:transcriptional regulator with XRE-family HTH domain